MIIDPLLETEDETYEKTIPVTAKSDEGVDYFVLSDSMQNTLRMVEEEGKQINPNNPILDKYEKFEVKGKIYYGVPKEKQKVMVSDEEKYFDLVSYDINPEKKEFRYRPGKTELGKEYIKDPKNLNKIEEYKDYVYVGDDIEIDPMSGELDPTTIPLNSI